MSVSSLASLRRQMMVLIATSGMAATEVTAASLFGDYTCAQWQAAAYSAKKAWADAFLAPLSLTIKSMQKSSQDAYNDDPKASQTAVAYIDAYCLSHPERGAADGAADYFKRLMRP